MKKLLLTGMIFASAGAFARHWTVTTSCGKKANLETSNEVTNVQMQQYMTVINYNLCSTVPSVFIINP